MKRLRFSTRKVTPAVILQLILLVVLAVFAVYGSYANYLPATWYGISILVLAVPLTGWLYAKVIRPEMVFTEDVPLRKRNQAKWLAFVLFYFMVNLSFLFGIPIVAQTPFAEDVRLQDSVTWKSGVRRMGCDYQLTIKTHASLFQNDLCVDFSVYKKAREGGEVILVGKKSVLGIEVVDVQIKR